MQWISLFRKALGVKVRSAENQVKGKVKLALEKAMKAQRGSGGIGLLFL
jgi:hypothetical protein